METELTNVGRSRVCPNSGVNGVRDCDVGVLKEHSDAKDKQRDSKRGLRPLDEQRFSQVGTFQNSSENCGSLNPFRLSLDLPFRRIRSFQNPPWSRELSPRP